MGDHRWRALRVPLRGAAVVYAEAGAMNGTIENLSATGALVTVSGSLLPEAIFDLELKLGIDTCRVSAHTVRVELDQVQTSASTTAWRSRIAVAFDRVDPALLLSIEAATTGALRAAERRPILVIDEPGPRRHALTSELAARGMMPLTPRTPLEAIDLLTRTVLYVSVCLVERGMSELRGLVSDSFPWVLLADITDDVDDTVAHAVEAWSSTDVARLATLVTDHRRTHSYDHRARHR